MVARVAHSPRTEQRPPLILHSAALHGLAGEVVTLATRNSEAVPVAVLLTFLARFGCEAFNPHTQAPYLSIGETRHSPRLFVAVCGQTAKARKGTSAKPVERFFAFPSDFACRPQESPGPLSSGEGLIYAVRDTRESGDPEQESGTTDRRLFVLDEELAAALKATRREGNILSTVLRGFWDSGKAAPITKHNRVTATRAHVCVVAHITRDELVTALQNVELLNGFGNRFLWVLVHREKLVPLPVPMPEAEFLPLQGRLMERIRQAQGVGEVTFSSAARDLWCAVYERLSADRPGFIGAVTDRAEAQTARLALLYALLDGRNCIEVAHLNAALAVWSYCAESATRIFAGRGESPLDEKILAALRSAPLTSTNLSNALGRNMPAADIQAAVNRLRDSGLVQVWAEKTSGRPVTWIALRRDETNEINGLTRQNT